MNQTGIQTGLVVYQRHLTPGASCLYLLARVRGRKINPLAFSYIESKKYAIELDPDTYYTLAILTQMTSQDRARFQYFAEWAIELNSNDAFVLADLGTWMGYAGHWQQRKEWVVRSMLFNPKNQSWLYQVWHAGGVD